MRGQGISQLVWDVPTRLFHWLLVAVIAFSWWSAENHEMEWHYKSGLLACFLILFRLVWGVIGTSTSRFSQFVKGPGAIIAYLRAPKGMPAAPGHNPLGALSVVAMLLAVVAQVGLGLFAVDVDGLESGPLSDLVSFSAGRTAAELHEVVFNILLALIALHVLAVLFYLVVRKRNLIRPMVTGHTREPGIATLPVHAVPLWRVGVAAIIAFGVTWAIANGFAFL